MNPFVQDTFIPIYDFKALEEEPDPPPDAPGFTIFLHSDPWVDLNTPFPPPTPKPKTFADILAESLATGKHIKVKKV